MPIRPLIRSISTAAELVSWASNWRCLSLGISNILKSDTNHKTQEKCSFLNNVRWNDGKTIYERRDVGVYENLTLNDFIKKNNFHMYNIFNQFQWFHQFYLVSKLVKTYIIIRDYLGKIFRSQNLTSVDVRFTDVRFWHLKTVPALKELNKL